MQRGSGAPLALWVGVMSASALLTGAAAGDVVLDSSFGSGVVESGVDRNGVKFAHFLLQEDAGKRVGDTLMFSASSFDVPQNKVATFDGDVATSVIIVRVPTGGPSLIDGTLDSTYTVTGDPDDPGADLFFFNPSGVIFGAGARLGPSFSGSFYASTADQLHLQDGTVIPMGQVGDSLLTSAPPIAFGFLSNAPASIEVQSSLLVVQQGQTLGLVGGDIDIQGFFTLTNLGAPGGRIQLASLAGPGVVPLDLASFDISSLPPDSLGSIVLREQAFLDVSGFTIDSVDDGEFVSDGRSGSVIIRSGRFQIRDGFIMAANYSSQDAEPQAVDIRASIDVEIRQAFIDNGTVNEGAAGDLLIEAPDIDIAGAKYLHTIISKSQSSGNGGSIELRAENTLIIRGSTDVSSEASPDTTADSRGGDIILSAPVIEIRDRGRVSASTSGEARGGNVSVDAGLLLIHTGLDDTGGDAEEPGQLVVATSGMVSTAGPSGDLSVRADTIQLLDGGQISATTTGSAAAGELRVVADSIEIRGLSRVPLPTVRVPSGIFNRPLGSATGPGGELIIEADLLAVHNGGTISARTFGAADAGNVTIAANRLILAGGENGASLISARAASGDGGSLTLTGRDLELELEIRSGGQIVAEATGSGMSGDIDITANAISIRGSDSTPQRNPSAISTIGRGAGESGTIVIKADTVTLEDGGQISATAKGIGPSGDIDIRARIIRVTGIGQDTGLPSAISAATETPVSTSAEEGEGGDLQITASEAIVVSDGALISVETSGQANSGEIELVGGERIEVRDGASISARTTGTGGAGSIIIHDTLEVALRDGTIQASTVGFGSSGSIAIGAVNGVTLIDGSSPGAVDTLSLAAAASIGVESAGAANAGSINIRTHTSVRLAEGSSLTTAAPQSDGGVITVQPGQLLDLRSSTITATVDDSPSRPEPTTGGNILIQGNSVVLQSSSIVAKANQGFGGFIFVQASNLLVDEQSEINAASNQPERSGEVEILTPDVDLAGNLVQLSESLLDVSALLADQCTAVTAPQGSLVFRQRVPLMSSPDDPLQSFYLGEPL